MHNFEFVKPSTLADAVAALGTDEAQPLSGGQTLIPSMKARLNAPCAGQPDRHCRVEGRLPRRRYAGDWGGHNACHCCRRCGRDFPGLAALAGQIGDPAVRNRGTIGGSLANNDPSACYPAAALGTGATIVTNAREIAADDYFQGMFTTALEEGEIITEVRFPHPATGSLCEIPATGVAFRADRGVCGAICIWRAGGCYGGV
jgi:aerobic carbon-monoxide dehydrogenase medium subunit